MKSSGLSEEVYKLILDFEVGGGYHYYKKHLAKPTYPGGASGVTIGIGYDLGYKTHAQFKKDWGHLPEDQFKALDRCIGLKRDEAKAACKNLNFKISWNDAEHVFRHITIPRYIATVKRAFPNWEKLDPITFGVLVSLVFNRGARMSGETRKEMREIKAAIQSKSGRELQLYIAKKIREMKRLWVGKHLDGLLARRDAEADLIEKNLV